MYTCKQIYIHICMRTERSLQNIMGILFGSGNLSHTHTHTPKTRAQRPFQNIMRILFGTGISRQIRPDILLMILLVQQHPPLASHPSPTRTPLRPRYTSSRALATCSNSDRPPPTPSSTPPTPRLRRRARAQRRERPSRGSEL